MRLLLTFLLGIVSAFYFSDLISRISHKVKFLSAISFNFGLLGLLAVVAGLAFGTLNQADPVLTLLSALVAGSGFGILAYQVMSRSFLVAPQVESSFIERHEGQIDRLLEMLPGALTWLALTSPIWLSYALPLAVAYLIIIADVYWLFSAFRYSITIFIGYRRVQKVTKTNWLERLEQDFPNQWQNYYQMFVIPTFKEGLEILAPAIDAIVNSNYPSKKIFIAVGFEERDDPAKIEQTTKYLQKYASKMAGIITTIHPYKLPGEVPGPGTNRNWLINHSTDKFKKLGIDPSQVFVTTLDADFVVHPQFAAGALHKYLSQPSDMRDVYSYTGVFFFTNNYWQAPTPMRLIATGTGFWQLSEMVVSDKYINYSSMSMNLQSLLDVGLWPPNRVNDDSGFYWKAYYHFKGKYKVLPHFLPISGDAVLDVTLLKTFQNQYLQLKRWAYGVEHIPFIFRQYFKNKNVDFWDKTDKLTFIMWSYFKWGTLALFITFGGLLIPVFNPTYSQSVVAYNLSIVSSWILTLAFVGLFTTVYVNEKTVPPRPKNWGVVQRVWSYAQWALVPVVLVTIATFPAIDAQTSLMLGRYMAFRVTNKARVLK
ncbi:glycosyltransferase family 2 protein [Candidatus Daviesbacteria bacterium]|nr:glycosyltransferase family 2 protein [Candidatus Daviesbacteria bacterium]